MDSTKSYIMEQVNGAGGSLAYADLRAKAPHAHIAMLPRAMYALQADGVLNPVTAFADGVVSFVLYAVPQEMNNAII